MEPNDSYGVSFYGKAKNTPHSLMAEIRGLYGGSRMADGYIAHLSPLL